MTVASAVLAPPDTGIEPPVERIALVGNPNTGKTTLFNVLCGARAKVSNFPGTTTSRRAGHTSIREREASAEVVDLPGVYDLQSDAPEARIVRKALDQDAPSGPDTVLVVVDACNLTRNLVLVAQLLGRPTRLVVAMNMVDLAARDGLAIAPSILERRLGVPVVPIVARKGQGLDALSDRLAGLERQAAQVRPRDIPPVDATPEALTRWAESVASEATTGARPAFPLNSRTERLDRILTHPVFGLGAFLAVMGGLFWILFALAAVPMDLIEATFAQLGRLTATSLPPGPVRDLIADGLVGGIAGTVVFLPQICLLFFLITLLEDTGYLARAAFVMDRLLARFGLPGHAFVPLLTSHACALPGIMSTRLIPDRRDRLATILIAPFMSCSARLPVYVLLTTLLFAGRPAAAGLAFAGCYLLGATAALVTAKIFGRTILKGRVRPMVLELPTYKTPSLRNALLTAKDQGLAFIRTAGTIIVAICVIMWWLSAYPVVPAPPEAEALRAEAAVLSPDEPRAQALVEEAGILDARAQQAGSFAGRLGHAIEPVFRPLGFDWQLTVGVVTSFLAREVFVSTMSVLAGGQGEADVDEGVVDRIRGMTRADGRPVFTAATSAAALVFFVLAMQCLPTLAVTRKETGTLKYAAIQLVYMSSLAYVAAFIVYRGLQWAGVS